MAKNINTELDWLEMRAEQIKKYVDDNPYHEVEDRTRNLYDFAGEVKKIEIIQKIEVIHKSLRDSMKEYIEIIKQLDVLREEEKKKAPVTARGSKDMSPRMKKLANGG